MSEKTYIIEDMKNFYPRHVFECGQCFRWNRQEDGSYTGTAGGRVLNVQFEPHDSRAQAGRLILKGCSEADFEDFWKNYFDLDRDYDKIRRKLCRGDKVMKRAADFGFGIRILNQDLWETIVSFIISQNNHIPRIKGCIEKLAVLFGDPILPGNDCREETRGSEQSFLFREKRYDIPSPERLAALTAEDLAPVKLGYRAGYLIKTAKIVCSEGLPKNREELSGLCGVGPKVAACIGLFGMGCRESFPIDVWVARVMHLLYGLDEKDKSAMADFAKEKFGELGGYAQQYLFYYSRENKLSLQQNV